MSAGYSGTPLGKKLGFKAGQRICAPGAPSNYRKLVAPLPDGHRVSSPGFENRRTSCTSSPRRRWSSRKNLLAWLKVLGPDAVIWVSWPKKASKVPTDISEDTVRAVALPMGLVDIKVCAVDGTWSGLKLVLRQELRAR
jgi:hypothetical protein